MDDFKTCFLCKRNRNSDRLERHHIFGAGNRPKSEKYGLVVYLCGDRCHRNGTYSAHKNKQVADYLHRYGQEKFMKEQNKTKEQFIAEFGMNYLD